MGIEKRPQSTPLMSDRAREHTELAQKKSVFGEVEESVQYMLSPRSFIGGRDMPIFDKAGVTDKKELRWIASVKMHSIQEARRFASQGFKEVSEKVNAYDLIRLHALMIRDLRTLGQDVISKDTEHALDDIYEALSKPIANYRVMLSYKPTDPELQRLFTSVSESNGDSNYFKQVKTVCDLYDEAVTHQQKMTVITKFLNIVHTGGNAEGFDHFIGVPVPENGNAHERMGAEMRFLTLLNNLGHQDDFPDEDVSQ